jgi:hypothetical protein
MSKGSISKKQKSDALEKHKENEKEEKDLNEFFTPSECI